MHWLTAQVEAGGVSVVGMLATGAALGLLNETATSASILLQTALVAVVTALIGFCDSWRCAGCSTRRHPPRQDSRFPESRGSHRSVAWAV